MATPASPPAPRRSETDETIRFLLKLALIALIVRSFVFQPFSIPSESMLPRLLIGDYLFVTKWNYGYSRWSLPGGVPLIPGHPFARVPARGDVVVFRSPDPAPGDTDPAHADHDVIKRVIGLPGDTIQVRRGQLILDGRAIPKRRVADFMLPLTANFGAAKCASQFQDVDAAGTAICRYPQFRETLPGGRSYLVLDQGDLPDRDDTDVYTVPAGTVFLMGDNRDDSADSRFAAPEGMGYIPLDRIEGKAVVGFFSTDGLGVVGEAVDLVLGGAVASHRGRVLSGDLDGWLAATFGRAPADPAPFARALTHGSQAAANYERLEFLGDRVLGLVVAEWLWELFPDEAEGALSKRLNALVTGAVCAEVARECGVRDHLRLGKQARDDGAADSDNVLGDVMEALIGAWYRDAGLDAARAFIRQAWGRRVHAHDKAPQHPKSALQEWAAAHNRRPPDYVVIDRAGPGHAPRFTVAVTIGTLAPVAATGGSKQEAETAAAKAMLEKLT